MLCKITFKEAVLVHLECSGLRWKRVHPEVWGASCCLEQRGRGRAAAQSWGASLGSWARARLTGAAGAFFTLGRADGVGRAGRAGVGTTTGEGEIKDEILGIDNVRDLWGRDPHNFREKRACLQKCCPSAYLGCALKRVPDPPKAAQRTPEAVVSQTGSGDSSNVCGLPLPPAPAFAALQLRSGLFVRWCLEPESPLWFFLARMSSGLQRWPDWSSSVVWGRTKGLQEKNRHVPSVVSAWSHAFGGQRPCSRTSRVSSSVTYLH